MLKSNKAKISVLLVGFLVLCGTAIVAVKSFASSNNSEILTFRIYNRTEQQDSNVVVLDGSKSVVLDLSLSAMVSSRVFSVNGTFAKPQNYEQQESHEYIYPSNFLSEMMSPDSHQDYNISTGNFSFVCDTIDKCYETGANYNLYTMTYVIPQNTPAGIYHIPIHIENLQTLDSDGAFDVHEEDVTLDAYITIKRPSEITFWDEDGDPITEINKSYGDSDFMVTKGVSEGDGRIVNYYVESESEERVVDLIPNSDYIHINKIGYARICAVVEDTDLYIGTEDCFTVYIDKRQIWVKELSLVDKQYDGSTSIELDELIFYSLDSDERPIDTEIDPSEYTAWSSVDNANVGEKLATVGIYLNEEGDKHYYLSENTYTAPVTISPAVLHDMSAIISSGEYDGTPQYPTIANVAGMSESGEVYLEENVDFVVTYLEDNPYVGDYFVEVGDYQITVSPLQGSNYTFEPFEMTFTVRPKRLTVTDAIVENKYYNNSNYAVVSSVQFDGAELQYGHDYEAYAFLESSDVGTWRAQLEIIVYNARYCFYDEQNPDTYPLQTYYEVDGVEILPRELTEDRTNVQVLYGYYDYTGEENKPPLEVSTMYPYDSGEEDFHPLYLDDGYTVVYPEDTINAGVKHLTVKGINNFSGSITVEYTIEPALVHDLEISTSEQTYTGEALEPEPVVTANFYGDRITLSTNDYDILHQEEFVDAGSYSFTVQDSDGSNYRFSDTDATFTIIPYDISSSDISLSETTYKHDGISHVPDVTVAVGNTTIDADDYDVEFSADTIGNDESDTVVTVTVRAKENTNISGEATTTYTITPREVLTIRGIEDNQQIVYNGSPVVLEGNVMVEDNPGGIVAEDLVVQWYASDGVTVIDRPTNAGSYKVVYSYEDANYCGSLVVNFEITKASSPSPVETETDFKIAAGQTLAELVGERTVGFNWTNSNTVVTQGNNVYTATYTYNGDAENYETLSLTIPVYGLAHVHINTTESEGGEVTVSSQEVLEGETITITIAPERGQILDSITVNGVDYTNSVDNNTISIVAGADDIEIAATFTQLQYDVIEGAGQIIDLDKDDTAKFRIDADYGLFADGAVYVDGTLVGAENYTSWDGSTYVQLTNDYLNTLSAGEHTLTIAFNDGGIATTTFTILKADDSGNNEGGNDNTNDDDNKHSKNAIAPNTGFTTMVSGGATATVGLLAVVLIAGVAMRKIRK